MQLLTVSEINIYLRELLDSDEIVRDIWVQGEISNFNRHSSGHCYFSMKQDNAVLRAVMWRTQAQRLAALPSNGDAVLAHGRVSFYEARGDLQLYVDTIQPAGVGLLHARFEELKQRLEHEGLFDSERKRPLPALPRRIGIVTAPQSAALADMLTILGRRCPLVEVVLVPCLVQGERAPDSIVDALYQLYEQEIDVVLLARGGGSIEDLWAFNDEIVARAVFASPVPLITGVGHENDTTIVDYIADLRAPTPSAAAELAVPEWEELQFALDAQQQNLVLALEQALAVRREQISAAERALVRMAPLNQIAHDRQHIDDLLRRVSAHTAHATALRRERLHRLDAQLAALSPRATLERGYAVVRQTSSERVVTDPAQVVPGERVAIMLAAGDVLADIVDNEELA